MSGKDACLSSILRAHCRFSGQAMVKSIIYAVLRLRAPTWHAY
jgi:hypothetical protein